MDPINTVSQVPPVLPVPPVPPLEPAGQPVQTPPLPIEVPPPANKNSLLFKFALFALLFSFVAAGIYIVWVKVIPKMGQKACTMEAKVCPDGTSVGRVAPSCDFAPCPSPTSTPDETANRKIYINNQYNYSLELPQDWIINAEEKSPAQSKIDPGQIISKIKFNNETSSVEIFYEGDWDHGFEPWVFEEKETIYLGGKDANDTILGLEGKSSKWHIISIESFNNFRIEANIAQGDNEIFDQILSTFKFLEATPSASPQ